MRRSLVLAACAALTTCAAGCTSDGPGGGSTTQAGNPTTPVTTTTVVTTPPPSSSSAPGAPPSSGASSSRAGSSSACAESQLRAGIDQRHIPGNGTPDSSGRARHGVLVDFLNKSNSTCTLTGYPGAAIEDSSNRQVQQARRTLRGSLGGLPADRTGYSDVTLRPGQSAAALLEGVDQRERGAAQAGCDADYPRILVTPPNTTIPVPFTVGWPRCYSFDVHPVRLLSGG